MHGIPREIPLCIRQPSNIPHSRLAGWVESTYLCLCAVFRWDTIELVKELMRHDVDSKIRNEDDLQAVDLAKVGSHKIYRLSNNFVHKSLQLHLNITRND